MRSNQRVTVALPRPCAMLSTNLDSSVEMWTEPLQSYGSGGSRCRAACQPESLVVRVPNPNCKSASLETGFQVEHAEHFHHIARHCELFVDHTDMAVAQGFDWVSTTAACGIGIWVAVAGGVARLASSARVILPVHEISVLVSDI